MRATVGENIRYFAGAFVGLKLLDVTQNDEPCEDPAGRFIELLFEGNATWRIYTRNNPSFRMEHPEECQCEACKSEVAR